MEGILLEIESILSPFAVLSGLALIVVGACGILLGHMSDEEAEGRKVYWAESPFTDVSEPTAREETVKYPRAA
ncbi:MAG: hypothetical protein HY896_07745 [Deltaproteobacteria bacterium]|nr:hypothetical protein [Deltaproteobacteria bacterium]